MTQDVRDELRAHLERRADSVIPSPGAVTSVLAAVRRDQRRRRAVALAGVAALTAAAAAVAVVPDHLGRPNTQAPARNIGDRRLLSVATAGDLAGDPAWVAQATTRAAALTGRPVPHALFAGRVGHGSALLAVVDEGSGAGMQIQGFTSPSPSAGELTAATPYGFGDPVHLPGNKAGTIAWELRLPGAGRFFVVIPGPGVDHLQVSGGPRIGPGGRITRDFLTVQIHDGAAVGPLPEASLDIAEVRAGSGPRISFGITDRDHLTLTPQQLRALVDGLAAHWGATVPDPDLVQSALAEILRFTDPAQISVEPVFVGREQPSNAQTIAAQVRLKGGGTLQVVGLFDARNPRSMAIAVPLAGRLVRAGDPATVPFAWLDDLSFPGDDVQARARIIQPGAARVEVRDTGARPCAPSRQIAAGAPDPAGLTTLVIRLPRACQDPQKPGESLVGYSRIQAIAYDSTGAEIGRSPVALSTDYDLPDAP